jgi:anaerobic selenocysteine-containing dehydrogenase
VFGTIYINPIDTSLLGLTPDQEVLVSNKNGRAKYNLGENSDLKPGIALIYSGFPFPNAEHKNVNIFTPEMAEESGRSGAYFSTIVKITKI